MVAIHAISGRTLALGRDGENLARQVVFDISEWRASYGDGTVSLIAQRHGDAEPYPCNITVDGDTVTWPITSADTACPDYGHCELRYSVGDVLVKSEMWRTFVADALGTPQPEPPEPQKAWVDKVLAAGQAAVDASVNPPQIGENGNWFVWDFDAGMYVDTGVAASGGGSGAVSSVNGQTGAVELTAEDVGAVSVPATASVGQTVVVKAVDEAGRPTEWEAADKLPKSPTDWEPWTAKEQAAARERIGIDKFEEIAIITLAEDSTPVIDLGAEYEKLFIAFEIPSGDTCIGSNYIINQNKMSIGYFPSNTVFLNSAKFATCIISKYGDYWTCDINYGTNKSASNIGSNRSAYKVSDNIVTQLNFSSPIRAGSKISVYGVRVS